MFEPHCGGAPLCHECECVFVPRERNSKGFSPMPCDLKLAIETRTLENALAHQVERREAHPRPYRAVWKVAVGTVNIAERRRLQNKQP